MKNRNTTTARQNTLFLIFGMLLVMLSVVAMLLVCYFMKEQFNDWAMLSVIFVLGSFVALTQVVQRQAGWSQIKAMQNMLIFKTVKFFVAMVMIVLYVVLIKDLVLSFAIMFLVFYAISTVLESIIILNVQKGRKAEQPTKGKEEQKGAKKE